MRTRIKFCGITRLEDAQAAVRLGVDALGFVLVRSSPRSLSPESAAAIIRRLPPMVQTVALFQNAPQADVSAAVRLLNPDLLQFHGLETPEFCERFGVRYIKAVPMAERQDLGIWCSRYARSTALLLDGHGAGESGGQGKTFDWKRAQQDMDRPMVLSGGLAPDNVAEAIQQVRPYAVDVSSGIEQGPGLKDFSRMKAFIEAVWVADAGF